MTDGYVYVVGSGRPGDPVKIGHSANPKERVRSLQTGAPYLIRLLDQHPGPGALERYLHRRFEDSKVHGEWFLILDPVPTIAEAVQAWPGELESSPHGPYAFEGPHVSVDLRQGKELASAASGLTDREFRVMVWYWFATEEAQGAVLRTQAEIAEELGMNPDSLGRIVKVLHGARLLVEAGKPLGRVRFYRCNPYLAFAGASFTPLDGTQNPEPPTTRVRP